MNEQQKEQKISMLESEVRMLNNRLGSILKFQEKIVKALSDNNIDIIKNKSGYVSEQDGYVTTPEEKQLLREQEQREIEASKEYKIKMYQKKSLYLSKIRSRGGQLHAFCFKGDIKYIRLMPSRIVTRTKPGDNNSVQTQYYGFIYPDGDIPYFISDYITFSFEEGNPEPDNSYDAQNILYEQISKLGLTGSNNWELVGKKIKWR